MNADSSAERFIILGQVYLSLPAVARCFDVRVAWLEQVCEHGLLGRCRRVESGVAVAATELDRVAYIVRLHFYQGIALTGIALLLGRAVADPPEDVG